MGIEIRRCLVSDIQQSPAVDDIVREYADESSIKEIGEAEPDFAMYQSMEESGVLHAIGAFDGDDLVGFAFVFYYGLPHYKGRCIATTESIFVLHKHRKNGAGIKLIRAAESMARELGAPALLISSPYGGRLATVLPQLSYRQSNQVFVIGLK